MSRGVLTDSVKELSLELFGYEITVKELRLLPYILDCLLNNRNVDPNKIDQTEREIMSKWRDEGRMKDPASGLTVTPEFYDMICIVVKIGYCSSMIDDLF